MVAQVTLRVLLIENEPFLAEHWASQLAVAGYTIAGIYPSGEEAIAAAIAPPDVALIDIHLDGEMDGIETAARLRVRFGELRVVFLSADDDGDTIHRAARANASGYIVKPFFVETLLETMECLAACSPDSENELTRLDRKIDLAAVLSAEVGRVAARDAERGTRK